MKTASGERRVRSKPGTVPIVMLGGGPTTTTVNIVNVHIATYSTQV
jgi:hypothetical protein